MGAAAPKPPHVIHPYSKLWGVLAFSHELVGEETYILITDNLLERMHP